MIIGSADLNESGGRILSEGFLDLFAVGVKVVHCCREVFSEQEVLPHRSVRVEFSDYDASFNRFEGYVNDGFKGIYREKSAAARGLSAVGAD